MTDIHDPLRNNNDRLLHEYDTARPEVAALLDTLHQRVLPQLALELALPDSDIAWLSEWFSDTASMFRLLRRHKFTCSFALQEISAISVWRVRVLRPILPLPLPTLFHCLPLPITDPLGRPVVFLKLTSLKSCPCPMKSALLQEVERLRLHLRYIRDHHVHTGDSPLQYLVIADLEGLSIQNCDLDLCSWFLTDIIPRYPGMLAAVFLLNYSWIHSSAWSVAKRVLPSSIIARIFFPSKAQLLSYCSTATLPAEYGGSLPTLDQIGDALHPAGPAQHSTQSPPLPQCLTASSSSPRTTDENLTSPSSATLTTPSASALPHPPSTIALPPFSPRNPFYGYPVITSASSPHTVQHVQRGLRELLYTLAVLWWRRWRRWVRAGICVCACGVLLVLMQKMRHTRVRLGIRTVKEAVKAIMDLKRARITPT